jgi:hypothetical protein
MPVAEKERKEEIKKQEKQVEEKYGETRTYYENISKVLSFYLTGKNWDDLSREEKKGLDKKTLENWYGYFQKNGIKQGSLNLEAEKLQPLLFSILIVTGTGKVGMEAIKEISKEEANTTEDIINRVLNWANEKKEKGHVGYFTYFNSLKGYVDGNEKLKTNMEFILKMAKDKRSEWGFEAVTEKLSQIKKEINKEEKTEPIMPMPIKEEESKELEKEEKEESKKPFVPKIEKEEKKVQGKQTMEEISAMSYKEIKENVLDFINKAKKENYNLNKYFSYVDFSDANVKENEILIGYSIHNLPTSFPRSDLENAKNVVKRWNDTIGEFAKKLIKESDEALLKLDYDIEKVKDKEKEVAKVMLNGMAEREGLLNGKIVFTKNGKTIIDLKDLFVLYEQAKGQEKMEIINHLFILTDRDFDKFVKTPSFNKLVKIPLSEKTWNNKITTAIEADKDGKFLGNVLLYLISPKVDEKNAEASIYVEKNGKPIVVKVSEMSGNANNYAKLAFYKSSKELGKIETESKEEKKGEVKKTETKVVEGKKEIEKKGGEERGEVKTGDKETEKKEETVKEKKGGKEKAENKKEEVKVKEDKVEGREEREKETEGEYIDETDIELEEIH